MAFKFWKSVATKNWTFGQWNQFLSHCASSSSILSQHYFNLTPTPIRYSITVLRRRRLFIDNLNTYLIFVSADLHCLQFSMKKILIKKIKSYKIKSRRFFLPDLNYESNNEESKRNLIVQRRFPRQKSNIF